jgi:hypothetical protein
LEERYREGGRDRYKSDSERERERDRVCERERGERDRERESERESKILANLSNREIKRKQRLITQNYKYKFFSS